VSRFRLFPFVVSLLHRRIITAPESEQFPKKCTSSTSCQGWEKERMACLKLQVVNDLERLPLGWVYLELMWYLARSGVEMSWYFPRCRHLGFGPDQQQKTTSSESL